jgi:hypothetical protein
MVLTRARSTKGVDGVWNIESLADSARRSVVAAGDSLTARLRDSVVASLRQRAADSIAAVVALGGRAEAVLAKPALGKPRSTP